MGRQYHLESRDDDLQLREDWVAREHRKDATPRATQPPERRLCASDHAARDTGTPARGVAERSSSGRRPWHFGSVLAKGPLGNAIGYCLSQWDKLTTFRRDGRLELDDNRGVSVRQGHKTRRRG
jgi:hypothetical protein